MNENHPTTTRFCCQCQNNRPLFHCSALHLEPFCCSIQECDAVALGLGSHYSVCESIVLCVAFTPSALTLTTAPPLPPLLAACSLQKQPLSSSVNLGRVLSLLNRSASGGTNSSSTTRARMSNDLLRKEEVDLPTMDGAQWNRSKGLRASPSCW